jgi:outer membrane protein
MRLAAFGFAVLIAPATVWANDLMKVYELARRNDPTFLAAQYQRDANAAARPIALAPLLPQLVGAYQPSKDHFEFTPPDDQCPDPETGQPMPCPYESDTNPYTLSLRLTQSIFDWSAIETYRQAGDTAALAEVGYRAAQQNLLLRVAQTYFNVLAAADSLRASRGENKAVERQLEQARRRFDVGLSAITDVQEAQARYDLTVASAIQAEQNFRSSREALAEITGAQNIGLSSVQQDMGLPGPDPANVNKWTEVALQENLDLAAARLQTSIAKKGVSVARGGYMPVVTAQAQGVNGESSGFNRGYYEDRVYGVSVNMPLFNGLGTWHQVDRAQSIHEQRKAQELGVRRRVEHVTRDAYQAVLSGASRVKALKQAVLSNTTALQASEVGLQVGARTNVDVLNAQQLLYVAQRDYASTRYAYLVSVLSLKNAAGRLTEKDLAEVDRLLVSCDLSVQSNEDGICAVGKEF